MSQPVFNLKELWIVFLCFSELYILGLKDYWEVTDFMAIPTCCVQDRITQLRIQFSNVIAFSFKLQQCRCVSSLVPLLFCHDLCLNAQAEIMTWRLIMIKGVMWLKAQTKLEDIHHPLLMDQWPQRPFVLWLTWQTVADWFVINC